MAISTLQFNFIRNFVASRSGVVLAENQKYLTEARLLPLARQNKIGSVAELIHKIGEGKIAGMQEAALDALMPTETWFFRDNHPFDLLKNHILPTLEMKLSGQQRLTIWCAGCSTGQEVYSVGVLLYVYFPQLLKWQLELIGSDLCKEALQKAAEGKYNEIETHRGLSPYLVKQAFHQDGTTFTVREEIRKVAQFEQGNLMDEWPAGFEPDLVLLRNVLSYFTKPAKAAVLGKLQRVLKPDGYLLLGAQETTVDVESSFSLVPTEKTVYFQCRPAAVGA